MFKQKVGNVALRLRQILQIMKISIKNQNAAHIVKLNPLLNMGLIKGNKNITVDVVENYSQIRRELIS